MAYHSITIWTKSDFRSTAIPMRWLAHRCIFRSGCRAPLFGSRRTLGGLVDTINTNMKLITPASEVCSVESQWLSTLVYGTPNTQAPRTASPFRDDIAYGSVGGDNSAYFDFAPLQGISLYGAALFFQQPSHFPFLHLERRSGARGGFSPLIGGAGDYSDGLVPLWSTLIPGDAPGASKIVGASHSTYMSDRDTQEYVERWLNNAAMPTGRELRPQWNSSISSRDKRRTWAFQQGQMAPQNLSGLFACINGIARIQPDALHPDRTITISRKENRDVRVEWPLPAGGRLEDVVVYEDGPSAGSSRRRIVRAALADGRLSAQFAAPQNGNCFSIVAEGVVDNQPDQPVRVRSRMIHVTK